MAHAAAHPLTLLFQPLENAQDVHLVASPAPPISALNAPLDMIDHLTLDLPIVESVLKLNHVAVAAAIASMDTVSRATQDLH